MSNEVINYRKELARFSTKRLEKANDVVAFLAYETSAGDHPDCAVLRDVSDALNQEIYARESCREVAEVLVDQDESWISVDNAAETVRTVREAEYEALRRRYPTTYKESN